MGLVHKFLIRENISADGQLRYREREEVRERERKRTENTEYSETSGEEKVERRLDSSGREC